MTRRLLAPGRRVYSAVIARAERTATTTLMPPPRSVTARIRTLVPSLQPADARVARAILDDPQQTIRLTVTDVAGIAQTSASTVVRCCQTLGFAGYHDLKLALAQELGSEPQALPRDIAPDDPPGTILERILTADAGAVREALATIDRAAFEEAVETIATARRLLLVGVGTSAPLVQDAAYRLLTIGVVTEAPADIHVQHVAASLLSKGDACLAISHTGSTRETVDVVGAARRAGASTIAVTSFSRSPLLEVVDIPLVAGGTEISFRLEAMASRIAHLSLIDALYVAVALRTPDRSQAALDRAGRTISHHRY